MREMMFAVAAVSRFGNFIVDSSNLLEAYINRLDF